MSVTETRPDPCRICVEVERKRIDDSFHSEDPVDLLAHVVKEHPFAESVRDFVSSFGGEAECANCGEDFYTTYRTGGLGIVRDTYCPGCISREPLWELSATRVDTEDWFEKRSENYDPIRSAFRNPKGTQTNNT